MNQYFQGQVFANPAGIILVCLSGHGGPGMQLRQEHYVIRVSGLDAEVISDFFREMWRPMWPETLAKLLSLFRGRVLLDGRRFHHQDSMPCTSCSNDGGFRHIIVPIWIGVTPHTAGPLAEPREAFRLQVEPAKHSALILGLEPQVRASEPIGIDMLFSRVKTICEPAQATA